MQRAANRRCHRQCQGRAQRLDEHGIGQHKAPMIEGISQDEVADPLHETTQHQDRQRPDRQQREQQGDHAERNVVPSAEIDQAGTKAAGDRRVAAPLVKSSAAAE